MLKINRSGNTTQVSIYLPVVIRNPLNGGMPNLMGMGNSHGTPSLVKVSITRWLIIPSINARHTRSILTVCIIGWTKTSNQCDAKPNKASPKIECVKKRWPPKSLSKTLPTYLPTGKLRQNGAVGWSISGVMPPIRLARIAKIAVAKVKVCTGRTRNTTPNSVIAAKSWVRAVIYLMALSRAIPSSLTQNGSIDLSIWYFSTWMHLGRKPPTVK